MNKQKVTKRAYFTPCIEMCSMKNESPILANSPVTGGHHDAEDDGVLNAKEFHFDSNNEI